MGGDSPHKRKRDVSDIGDRAQKKAHIENRMLGITDLHLDVGEKYLLCRTRKAPFYPLTTPNEQPFTCIAFARCAVLNR